jgi:hypothetical protein
MLKDIKHDRIQKPEKLARNTQIKDVYIALVNLHTFFMNMVAERFWNKKF